MSPKNTVKKPKKVNTVFALSPPSAGTTVYAATEVPEIQAGNQFPGAGNSLKQSEQLHRASPAHPPIFRDSVKTTLMQEEVKTGKGLKIAALVLLTVAFLALIVFLIFGYSAAIWIAAITVQPGIIAAGIYASRKRKYRAKTQQTQNPSAPEPHAPDRGPSQALATAGIVLFVLALTIFFACLAVAQYGLLWICSIAAILSILFMGIGAGRSADGKRSATVLIILSFLLILLSELIRVFSQYP